MQKNWTPDTDKIVHELDLLLGRRTPVNTFKIIPTELFWQVVITDEQTKQTVNIECRTGMQLTRLTQALEHVGMKAIT